MGEIFITYEVLFAVGLLKTDMSGQAFFLQVERDHFPVPLPQLTKVDTWVNKANWRLDTAAHRSAIESNPIQAEFKRRNMLLRVPNFEPEVESTYNAIDQYNEGAEHTYAQGSGAPPQQQEKKKRRKLRATVAAIGGTAAVVDRILKSNSKPLPPPN